MKKYKVKLVIPATVIRQYEIEGNSKQDVINDLKHISHVLPYIEEIITISHEDGEIDSIEEI